MPTINPVLVINNYCVEEIKWETLDTYTLVLKPTEGVSTVKFKPGQWVYLHLLNPDGTSWARAAFSVATAPEESDEFFELALKIHGDFTKRGAQLQPGDLVGIQGPFGVFVLHEDVSPLIFFAGGIGITPFRSMIRSLALRKFPTEVILFYSNKSVEETAYFEEFEQLAKEWPSFKPVFFVTSHTSPKWSYEVGRINDEALGKYCKDFSQGEFLMCGPVPFMDAVKGLLEARGVDVKKRLRKELFG